MRIIVIHMRDRILDAEAGSDDHPAHCFGPFDSYEEALAWDMLAPDECYKMALDLVGPDPLDMAQQFEHGAHHEGWRGSGPRVRRN